MQRSRIGSARQLFLGLSFGHGDPSAAVVEGGQVLSFVEEERMVRVKHAPKLFPQHALDAALTLAGARPGEVAALGVHWNLPAYADGRIQRFYDRLNRRHGASAETLFWQATTLRTHTAAAVRRALATKLTAALPVVPRLLSFGHHFVHALQVASHSSFDHALVLTLDGSGDHLCSAAWRWQDGRLRRLRSLSMPHSLGWVYAAVTEYLGFRAYDGEQKVMAMAAFGDARGLAREVVSRMLTVQNDSYVVDARYLHQGLHSHSGRFTDALVEALGAAPRLDGEPFEQRHFDLAAAAQAQMEEAVLAFTRPLLKQPMPQAVCLGGGVALNVRLAGVLQQAFGLPVFTYPLASDVGAPIGAALAACRKVTGCQPLPLPSLALGPAPTESEAASAAAGRVSQRLEDSWDSLAACLAGGGIVGWIEGRMEGGARALGHRSLFCDPSHAGAVVALTNRVKSRQPWQPYGVSVLAADAHRYFVGPIAAEWMSIALPVTAAFRTEASLAVHRDGTTRPHLVHEDKQPKLARLLGAFRSRTGRGVLINTSFNRAGEPIVCTPAEALAVFDATPLSALVLHDRVLWRHAIPSSS